MSNLINVVYFNRTNSDFLDCCIKVGEYRDTIAEKPSYGTPYDSEYQDCIVSVWMSKDNFKEGNSIVHVEFKKDEYSSDSLNTLKKVVKGLEKLQKSYEKIVKEEGYPITFVQAVSQTVRAFKVKNNKMLFRGTGCGLTEISRAHLSYSVNETLKELVK